MNTRAPSHSVDSVQGFSVYRLGNGEIEIAVVPELGAKIISLKSLRTGREWLWQPAGGMKLFGNKTGDDFARGPLGGADECLPTIGPCSWQGRVLPDHGEVWSTPWTVDKNLLTQGILKTFVRLPISPFKMERSIELDGNEIRLAYQLTNLSAREEHYLWAFHPLLQLQSSDEIELPAATRALLNDTEWVDALNWPAPDKKCAKVFAQPVAEGVAAIRNRATRSALEFIWNPAENNTLGLWLSRGGWHGHDHFAIEPTNAATDALTAAANQGRCGKIAASQSVNWALRMRVT